MGVSGCVFRVVRFSPVTLHGRFVPARPPRESPRAGIPFPGGAAPSVSLRFGALIAMAGCLNKFGFIAWLSDNVVGIINSLGLPWQGSFVVITLIYFYSHYLFGSPPKWSWRADRARPRLALARVEGRAPQATATERNAVYMAPMCAAPLAKR